MKRHIKGSVTVEAAIIFPIFTIIVFSLIMLTKFVYIHAIMQQGMSESLKEIATYSYALEITNVSKVDQEFTNALEAKRDQLDEKLQIYIDFAEDVSELGETIESSVQEIKGAITEPINTISTELTTLAQVSEDMKDQVDQMKVIFEDTQKEITLATNKMREIESILSEVAVEDGEQIDYDNIEDLKQQLQDLNDSINQKVTELEEWADDLGTHGKAIKENVGQLKTGIESMNTSVQQVKTSVETCVGSLKNLYDIPGVIEGSITNVGGKIEDVKESGGAVAEDLESTLKNPKEFLVNVLSSGTLMLYEGGQGVAVGAITKMLIPHYLGDKTKEELDRQFVLLGVQNGYKGVKITGKTREISEDIKAIDVIATYKVNMDAPLNVFLNDITITQRASIIPWLGDGTHYDP